MRFLTVFVAFSIIFLSVDVSAQEAIYRRSASDFENNNINNTVNDNPWLQNRRLETPRSLSRQTRQVRVPRRQATTAAKIIPADTPRGRFLEVTLDDIRAREHVYFDRLQEKTDLWTDRRNNRDFVRKDRWNSRRAWSSQPYQYNKTSARHDYRAYREGNRDRFWRHENPPHIHGHSHHNQHNHGHENGRSVSPFDIR